MDTVHTDSVVLRQLSQSRPLDSADAWQHRVSELQGVIGSGLNKIYSWSSEQCPRLGYATCIITGKFIIRHLISTMRLFPSR